MLSTWNINPQGLPVWPRVTDCRVSFGCVFFDIRMISNLDKTPGNFVQILEYQQLPFATCYHKLFISF